MANVRDPNMALGGLSAWYNRMTLGQKQAVIDKLNKGKELHEAIREVLPDADERPPDDSE